MDYNDLRSTLKTGDIVLFSGHGPISMLIRLATKSKWSHVGMVMKIEEYDMLLLWESTSLNGVLGVADVESGIPNRGVQTSVLSDKIEKFNGDIAIRKLNRELDAQKRKVLADLRNEWKTAPYETDYFELLMSAIDMKIFPENDEDLSSIFCSELLAEAFQRMGFIDESMPSNEFVPADFDNGKTLDNMMNGDYCYGDIIYIRE